MRQVRPLLGVMLIAAAICPPAVIAHPVPSDAHIRTVDVRLRPTELCVSYRLELDQFTTVFKDSKGLIEEAEVKRLNTPTAFYGEFTRRLAPLLADQLVATLNGQSITLRCIEHRFTVTDHLLCDFLFQADWSPRPDSENVFTFRDNTYDGEQGRVRLNVDEDNAIAVAHRSVPSALLQAKSPTDLGPGDDARLRTAKVTFRLSAVDAGITALHPTPSEKPDEHSHSTLLPLLDAPHGFGILLLLATLFGAAHALTPGHGKTLVAAYLIGERGTVWHAMVLGLTTTLTHTGTVIILAAGLWWWFPNQTPSWLQTVLGFVGGLLIAGLGLWLLLKRLAGGPDHIHVGGVGHTHNPDGTVTITERGEAGWGRLILLGISGGIVPCWDAIAMLGFAIVAQRLWLALPLLLAFSAGLAGVLVLIGIAVVYAQGRIGGTRWADSRIWRMLPVASAAVLVVMGLWLCRDSLTPG
jgi:nickel/cobalt exporter